MSPDLLEGALIAIGAFLAGQWLPRPHRRRYKPPKPVRPVCGCRHHYSFHDPRTGECHGKMDGKPIKYDEWKDPTAYEQINCTCRQYTGPTPLPEVYAPEITS